MIEIIGWTVLAVVFGIVSSITVAVLRRHSFCGVGTCVISGICVGLLSAIGIYQDGLIHSSGATVFELIPLGVRGILIPYAALAIVLLILLMAMLLLNCRNWFSRTVQVFIAWRTRPQRQRQTNERKGGSKPRIDPPQTQIPRLGARKAETRQRIDRGSDGSEKTAPRQTNTDWQ